MGGKQRASNGECSSLAETGLSEEAALKQVILFQQ